MESDNSETSGDISASEEEIIEGDVSEEIFEDGNDWIEITEFSREDTIPLMEPSPNNSIFATISPIDVFRGFFDDNIINGIIKNTNLFAKRTNSKPNPACPVKDINLLTKTELENWLAVTMMTGLVSTPNIADYWSKDPLFQNPAISSVMSFSRYKGIHLMLCLSSMKKGTSKLEPVYSLFRENCKKNYNLGKFILIKESTIKYKNKIHPVNTYNQPIKWDFKIFGLCDSTTGYMWNFEIYRYKRKTCWKDLCTIAPISLLEPLKENADKYYVVFDKLCPNLDLINIISNLGFSTTGTIEQNIKEIPIAEINKENPVQFFLKENLLFCAFYEKSHPQFFFSNVEGTQCKFSRSHTKNGYQFPTAKPVICIKHAYGMGGSAHFDNFIKPYSTARTSKIWWKGCFLYMLEIAITNSYIIYNHYVERGLAVNLTHAQFQRTLARQLINETEKEPEENKKTAKKPVYLLKLDPPRRCSYCLGIGIYDTTAPNCCAKCKKPLHVKCIEHHICLD